MNRTFYRTLLLAVFSMFAATVYGQSVNEQIHKSLVLIEIGNPKQALIDLQALSSSNPKNADALAAYSIAMMQNGKSLSDVETNLAKAYDMERKSALVRVARGMLFTRQGKREDASKEYAQAIKLEPKNIGMYLYTARFYIAVDSLKAAEISLLQAQVVNEKDVHTYIGLAELYEKQRAFDLAIGQYEDAKKIDPKDVTVLAKLAGLYYRQRRWDDAINEWLKIPKLDPTYSRAYFEIASIFFKARQYKNAADYAEKYHQLVPDDVDGTWLLAQSLSESNQYQKALPFLEIAAADDSLKAFVHLYLARSYSFSKEYKKADSMYNQGKNLSPYDYYYWGYSLINLSDTAQGIAKWRQSFANDTIRTTEDKMKVHSQIISLLSAQKKYADAAKEYEDMATLTPETAADWYVKSGQLYVFAEKYDDARRIFEEALKKQPKNVSAQVGLADISMQAEATTADAEKSLDAAAANATTVEQKESVGQGYARLGIKYYTFKSYDKSVAVLETSQKYLSEKSAYLINVHRVIAAGYLQLKKNDKAEEYYKKVLAVAPNDGDAKKALDYIKSLKGGGKK